MPRIPYERVAPEAEKLIDKMAQANDWDTAIRYWDQYTAFLEACGWNTVDFDRETTKRIDAGWENDPPKTLN